MNHNKTILTDVDGVLLSWECMFDTWMQMKGYTKIPGQGHTYNLESSWGITAAEVHQLINEFNSSAAIGFCPPTRDSVRHVKALAEQGYRFVAVTSMGGTIYSHKLREYNLERVFGPVFDSYHMIPLNTCKREVLQQWEGSGCWWIEDKLENALTGASLGLKSVLLTYDYNKHYQGTDLLVVDDWRDIYKAITGEQLP